MKCEPYVVVPLGPRRHCRSRGQGLAPRKPQATPHQVPGRSPWCRSSRKGGPSACGWGSGARLLSLVRQRPRRCASCAAERRAGHCIPVPTPPIVPACACTANTPNQQPRLPVSLQEVQGGYLGSLGLGREDPSTTSGDGLRTKEVIDVLPVSSSVVSVTHVRVWPAPCWWLRLVVADDENIPPPADELGTDLSANSGGITPCPGLHPQPVAAAEEGEDSPHGRPATD